MKTIFRLSLVVAFLVVSGSPVPGQQAQIHAVMREKLAHSQKVLEAIVTADLSALQSHSTALIRATESPAWSVLKSPEYIRQSTAFLRAAEDLVASAGRRDLDSAALNYVQLTLSCVECHRYIRNRRIVAR
jgi:hypothetical protein